MTERPWRACRRASIATRVLVLSMHEDLAYLRAVRAAGASGYVLKQSDRCSRTRGDGKQEIATQMLVSVKTVETYRARIDEKLGLRTGKKIVRFGIQMGLLTADTLASTPPLET